MCKAKRFI